MKRRTILSLAIPTIIGLSGCMNFGDDSVEEPTATISIEDRLCDDTGEEVNIQQNSEGETIDFFGTVENIDGNYDLDTSLYQSEKENSLVCAIIARQTESESSEGCSGSVEYSGTITPGDFPVEEITFLQEIGSEQSLIDRIDL